MNRVCEILNIEKPVIQAPMSWITSPEMCAAVSNAGGLGCLGANAGSETMKATVEETAEDMRWAIRKTKELTDRPFAVSLLPAGNDFQGYSLATCEVMKEEGVKIAVLAGIGCTADDVKTLKEDGFTVIFRELNPTVRSAQMAEAAGADIIVATGVDEGGTMPNIASGTLSMTALFTNAVKVPVLAAGGIINGKFAKATAIVGAEGAFVGTRFILSRECRASQAYKDDMMQCHPDDFIVFRQKHGLSQCRATPHKLATEALEANKKGDMNPNIGSYYSGMYKGDLNNGVNSVSNVVSLIKGIVSCETIVNDIAKGYEV